MSKLVFGFIGLLLVLSLLPFVLVARSRASRSPKEEIHLVPDMDNQPRFDPQSTNNMYADGRSMRPKIPGTVAQEDMMVQNEVVNDDNDPHLINGKPDEMQIKSPTEYAAVMLGRVRPANMTDAQFDAATPPADDKALAADHSFYVRTIPSEIQVTPDLVHRGQERFNIYCAPCHGISGYGDGMVNYRASALMAVGADGTSWVQPQNLNDPKILTRPDGSIFNTITNGARTMPPYDKQITVMDRWAIVAYVRALQESQNTAAIQQTASR